MAIEKELRDRLLADYKKPEDLIGESGLLKQLTKALLERALETELTDHLGHEKHAHIATKRGVPVMADHPKPLRANLVSCRLKFQETTTAVLSQSSSPRNRPELTVLTTK